MGLSTFCLGFSFLLFLFVNLFLKTLSLWIKSKHDVVLFLTSLILTQVFLLLVLKDRRQKLIVSLSFYFGLFVSFFLNHILMDLSFDGNWYHKEAIIQIVRGWNPFLDKPISQVLHASPWVDLFPKASWFIGSIFYGTFGQIEMAKTSNFILMLAGYFLSVGVSLKLAPKKTQMCWLIGFLGAFNPISIYLLFTLMIDGQMGALCLCLLVFLILIFKEDHKMSWVGLVLTGAYMATLKTSGLAYTLIVLAITTPFTLFYRPQLFKKFILASMAIMCLIILIGFNPYVTNFKEHGSPIYPFEGYTFSGVTPVTADHYNHLPEKYRSMNRFQKFFHSLFSASSQIGPPRLKIPFTVSHGEASVFSGMWDIRIGGFGPLFSGAFILSFVLLGLTSARFPRKDRIAIIYFPASVILVTALSNPESCWARYCPQVYLIPAYALGLYLITNLKRQKWSKYIVPSLLALALFINSWMVIENSLRRELGLSNSIDGLLRGLSGKTVLVKFALPPLRTRLEEYGIQYRIITPEEADHLKNGINVGGYMMLYPQE